MVLSRYLLVEQHGTTIASEAEETHSIHSFKITNGVLFGSFEPEKHWSNPSHHGSCDFWLRVLGKLH